MKTAPPFTVGVAEIIEHGGELARGQELVTRRANADRQAAAAARCIKTAAVTLP